MYISKKSKLIVWIGILALLISYYPNMGITSLAADDLSTQVPDKTKITITPTENYGEGWYLTSKEYVAYERDFELVGYIPDSGMSNKYSCFGAEGEFYSSYERFIGSLDSPSYYTTQKTTFSSAPLFLKEGEYYSMDLGAETISSNWFDLSANISFSIVEGIGYSGAGDFSFHDSAGTKQFTNYSAIVTNEAPIPSGNEGDLRYIKVNLGNKYGYRYTYQWFENAPGFSSVHSFTDFTSSHWSYTYVEYMVNKGIISGYPDNTFQPNIPFSRAAFAKLLSLSFDMDEYIGNEALYSDLPSNHWAYGYVMSANAYLTSYQNQAGDKLFLPGDDAVREDVAVAMIKAMELDLSKADLTYLDGYTDADMISPNFESYIALAIEYGVMTGSGGQFRPQAPLTRAEACTLFARFLMDIKNADSDGYSKIVN